jgi:hypothetical protein
MAECSSWRAPAGSEEWRAAPAVSTREQNVKKLCREFRGGLSLSPRCGKFRSRRGTWVDVAEGWELSSEVPALSLKIEEDKGGTPHSFARPEEKLAPDYSAVQTAFTSV